MQPHPIGQPTGKVYSLSFSGTTRDGRTCTPGSGYRFPPKITFEKPTRTVPPVKALAVTVVSESLGAFLAEANYDIDVQFSKFFELEATGTEQAQTAEEAFD